MQDYSDLTFLATYATLSLAAFAFLQRLVLSQSKVAARTKSASQKAK